MLRECMPDTGFIPLTILCANLWLDLLLGETLCQNLALLHCSPVLGESPYIPDMTGSPECDRRECVRHFD